MSGVYLHMINAFPYHRTFRQRSIKVQAISSFLRQNPSSHTYCETNHMFIKTFFDVVLNAYHNVEVIILRRELPLVLKSFLDLGYFGPNEKSWKRWMSSPNAVTAAISCIDSVDHLDQVDLCIAYLIDIEARSLRFRRTYPHIKVHEVRIEALNDYAEVFRFLTRLGLSPTRRTIKTIGSRTNLRLEAKKRYSSSAKVEYCRKRIHEYIGKASALGIELPSTLPLIPFEKKPEANLDAPF